MNCNHGIDQKINYCGLCEWKRAETALIQVRELEAMLLRINEHVFPGTSDSIDGLKRLVRERDQYYTEAKRQAERIAELEHERDQWKKECRGLQPGEPIWRRLADYQNENAKQAERVCAAEEKATAWVQTATRHQRNAQAMYDVLKDIRDNYECGAKVDAMIDAVFESSPTRQACKLPGCDIPDWGRGFCQTHQREVDAGARDVSSLTVQGANDE